MDLMTYFKNRFPCVIEGCKFKTKIDGDYCYKHFISQKKLRQKESKDSVEILLDNEQLLKYMKEDFHNHFAQKEETNQYEETK